MGILAFLWKACREKFTNFSGDKPRVEEDSTPCKIELKCARSSASVFGGSGLVLESVEAKDP